MSSVKIAIIDRASLADVLRGVLNARTHAVEIHDGQLVNRFRSPSVGIGYIDNQVDTLPCFVVLPDKNHEEFYAWVSSYCPFALPLSQWCRVVTVDELARLPSMVIVPQYGDAVTAWAGATVGEAILHMGIGIDLSPISVSALQSCASFVAARAFGLWRSKEILSSSVQRYESVRKLLGVAERRLNPLEYQELWTVLEILSDGPSRRDPDESAQVELAVQSCRDIQESGFVSEPTMLKVLEALRWPKVLKTFQREGAERRVVLFDEAADNLRRSTDRKRRRTKALEEFMVAYFAARVGGGGSGHLMLLERLVGEHPMLTVWYGVASALHRPEVWGAEFGGLGRLALKELTFPLRIDERPRCDIAFDELLTIVGPRPEIERLGFRGATRRALNVEVASGVSGLVGLSVWAEQEAATSGAKLEQAVLNELVAHLGMARECVKRLQEGGRNREGTRDGGLDRKSGIQGGLKRDVGDEKGGIGQLPLVDS